MITSLLGRKVQNHYGAESGTIVVVYLERGEIGLVVENPDNKLWTTNINSVTLEAVESVTHGCGACQPERPCDRHES